MINGRDSIHKKDIPSRDIYEPRENNRNILKRRSFVKSKELISFGSYFFFVIIRIVLVFIPEYGYIHPDEFFQTSEVISGK